MALVVATGLSGPKIIILRRKKVLLTTKPRAKGICGLSTKKNFFGFPNYQTNIVEAGPGYLTYNE